MGDLPVKTFAASPLLETKLYIPKWRRGHVSRPRLIERLDRGTERKMTLVSAPAGFGKTTLLVEWLAAAPASERSAAWVSLDQGDNDPAIFWAYFISALQKVRHGVGESALAQLYSPEPPPIEVLLGTLINEITATSHDASAGTGCDLVVVLDDYHFIDALPIHSAVTFLVDHLPPQMNLVITSRADPPLPLSHLRGRGELTELRASDLSFTPDEASAFLSQSMGLSLTASDVEALETRTEGWIAGLQLAALSMDGREDVSGFIEAFAGDDRHIVDYLVEEVLKRQPERVRSFLLQTSILDRLSGSLCDAVTGNEDGKEILEALEQANLFVVPLDDKRQWYRYHHLFQEFLRSRAVASGSEAAPELHRRAATWFEERNMAADAIEQARAAADHETVARLLAANFEEFQHLGQYASISRWSASLPDEMVQKRPRMALIHAQSALATEDNNEAVRKLTSWAEHAINVIEDDGGIDRSVDIDGTVVGFEGLDSLKGELLALKLVHSVRKLSPEEIARLAGQALELLPPGKHRIRGMIHLIYAGIQIDLGDMKSALPILEKGANEARRTQNSSLLAGVLAYRGQLSMAMGRLEDGRRSFEEALSSDRLASAESNWMMCGPHTWLAEIFLERADLAAATGHAAKAVASIKESPMRRYVLYGHATAAQVFTATGDTKEAIEELEKAQEFVRGSRDSRFFSYLAAVELKIYCWTDDLEAARNVVQARSLSPDVPVDHNNEEEVTAYARYLLSRGEYGDAEQVLARVLPIVQGRGHVQHEIHALVLHALANELLGERSVALASLGRATMLGEPGRFNRTFTSEGQIVTGLMDALANAVRRGRGPTEAGSPDYLAYLLREAGVGPETSSARSAASDLAEPLTTREVEILRYVAAGMTNQEIAEQLVVSMSTVKTHINRSYRKLDVRSRIQAVAKSRQLGIV